MSVRWYSMRSMKRGDWAQDRELLMRHARNGVIGSAKLRRLGVGAKTIVDGTTGGPWQRILPGLVLLHNGQPTRHERNTAAVMYGGTDVMLSGRAGLALHGFGASTQTTDTLLLIPDERNRKDSKFVVVERTTRLPEATTKRGLPVAPIDRCLLDASRRISDLRQCTALIAEVVQRGGAEIRALMRELDEGSSRGSAVPRRALHDLGDGAHSVAEVDARALCARSGLPPSMANCVILSEAGEFIAIMDNWWDDVAMGEEIESFQHHASPAAFEKTYERRTGIQSHGIVLTAHTPKAIRTQPNSVIADLRRAYDEASARPRPNVRAIPVSEWRQDAS